MVMGMVLVMVLAVASELESCAIINCLCTFDHSETAGIQSHETRPSQGSLHFPAWCLSLIFAEDLSYRPPPWQYVCCVSLVLSPGCHTYFVRSLFIYCYTSIVMSFHSLFPVRIVVPIRTRMLVTAGFLFRQTVLWRRPHSRLLPSPGGQGLNGGGGEHGVEFARLTPCARRDSKSAHQLTQNTQAGIPRLIWVPVCFSTAFPLPHHYHFTALPLPLPLPYHCLVGGVRTEEKSRFVRERRAGLVDLKTNQTRGLRSKCIAPDQTPCSQKTETGREIGRGIREQWVWFAVSVDGGLKPCASAQRGSNKH